MPLIKFCFIFLVVGFGWCNAQVSVAQDDLGTANAVDAEKIYLQLTGRAFNTSETVWFKAIVTNAFNNSLTGISGVLHVELINPIDKRIVDSKLLKLDNGVAESYFQLHPSYSEGKYQVRAYTEWNKNFSSDFIFSTYIDVYHFKLPEDRISPIRDVTITKDLNSKTVSISSRLFPNEVENQTEAMLYLSWEDGKDSMELKQKKVAPVLVEYKVPSDVNIINYRLKTKRKSYSKSIIIDKNIGALDFFPEGGYLVDGIKSTIGFKYLNYKGKGEKVKGTIVDQDNNVVSTFESNHMGMGKTVILPKAGKSYFGIVSLENSSSYRYPIPEAKVQGMVMRIISKPTLKLMVLNAQPTNSETVFLQLYYRGKRILKLNANLTDGNFSYSFKKSELPNGIIRATVYDSEHKPITERHFYNHKPEENLNIEIEADKQAYGKRDSVIVRVRSLIGNKPVPTSISLMAVDEDYFKTTNPDQRSILSYVMLESDIRGKIENPAYYFENEEQMKELDFLMLTQGWTNYKYDEQKKSKVIAPEIGLGLSGYIKGVQRRKKSKRLQNEKFDVALMIFGAQPTVYNQKIDSTGYFNFILEDSYGDGKKFVIEPASSVRANGRFDVEITNKDIPKIAYETDAVIVPPDSIVEKTIYERIKKDVALDSYLLPNTIALNEVVVSDYEMTPEREEMENLHGMPDTVVENKELIAKAEEWTESLFKWLQFNFRNDINVKRVGSRPGYLEATIPGADFTYIVVDGMPVLFDNFRLVPDIPIEAVKSVELIKNAPNAAIQYWLATFPQSRIDLAPQRSAILAIYTYSGKGLFGAFPGKTNLIMDTAPEFSPKREFYSPAYDNDEEDSGVPDLRKLIHWVPNIITDTKGNATIKFFNGDVAEKVLVICEGISFTKGAVGQSDLSYEVVE